MVDIAWFTKTKSLDELKKQYRELALQYHPDMPNGDTEKMKQINSEYDTLFPAFQTIYNRTAPTPSQESARQSRDEFYTQNGWKGANYDSNRSTGDVSKILREYVKRVYPDHKFSITTQYYSGGSDIHVALMTAPYEALKNGKQHSLNQYYLKEDEALTPAAKRVMLDINRVINSYRMSDCDSMIDYFNVSFYYNLSVGKWNKPFEVAERPAGRKTQKSVSEEVLDFSETDFLTDVDLEDDEDLEQ